VAVGSVKAGHHWQYYVSLPGKSSENYYTQGTDRGEPAGIWQGAGAATLGLTGEVTPLAMEAVYGERVDPRTADLEDRDQWVNADRLGAKPRRYKSKDELLAAALAREPEATPERVEQLRIQAGKSARQAVSFYDYTFSVQKSISILHTAVRAQEETARREGRVEDVEFWADKAAKIESAIWKGNNAALSYLADHAGYARVGYHGKTRTGETVGRRVDAHGLVVASFLQYTARPSGARGETPQVHIHNPIGNFVECPDGQWRTLDGRGIYRERGAATAFGGTVTEEDLTRTLGLEFRWTEDRKSLEIVGVSAEARELMSPRRTAITERVGVYVDAFRDRHGREPNTLELSQISYRAALATRERKLPSPTTAAERMARWDAELREHTNTTLEETAHAALGRITDPEAAAEAFSPTEVISRAVTAVQEKKSAWTRGDLIVELRRAMPACLGAVNEDTIRSALNELADRATAPWVDVEDPTTDRREEVYRLTAPELIAAPEELRRSRGESLYSTHGRDLYATRGQLDAEAGIETSATTVGAPRVDDRAARRVLKELDARLAEDGHRLGADQAAAIAGVLTSGRRTDVLIGPAGTGKSYTMGALSGAWERELGGRVFGLALAQKAADVLREEGLSKTENISQWLRVQAAIEDGTVRPADEIRWGLRHGDLLVVDESGMASNAMLAEVQQRAEAAGAKVLLTGDPQQLSAVGSGGALRLAHQAGYAYELSEVYRFAAPWEQDASLRLREGDADVLTEYDKHGRIRDGGSVEEAYAAATDAYVADILAGRQPMIVVGTNAAAADLSAEIRARLVALGRVEESGVVIGDGDETNLAGVGDIIAARENDRRIKNAAGAWVVNRREYQIEKTKADGGLVVRTVTGYRDGGPTLGGRLTLPAEYVQEHASLAYAATVHGAQGATVDRCYFIAGENTGPDALYVGMTRGRDGNWVYVVTDAEWNVLREAKTREELDAAFIEGPSASQQRQAEVERPEARDVLAGIIEREAPDRSATETMRDEFAEAASMRTLGSKWVDLQRQLSEADNHAILAELLPEYIAELDRDEATGSLYRLMDACESAGLDKRDTVAAAIAERALREDPNDDQARSIAEVMHYRLKNRLGAQDPTEGTPEDVEPTGDTYTEWTREGFTPVHQFTRAHARAADERAGTLGAAVAAEEPRPPWAKKHLGEPPEDPIDRAEWETRAGRVASYREMYGVDDDADPIGPAPSVHNVERRQAWYAAWRALDRPELAADEAALAAGILRQRTADYALAEQWAPPAVAAELRDASQAAQDAERAAILAEEAAARAVGDATLAQAAEAARAEHERAEQVRAELAEVDQVRGEWYLDTAETRALADRARAELRARGLEAPATATADELAQHQTLRRLAEAELITDADHQTLARDERGLYRDEMWREVDAVADRLGRDRYDVMAEVMKPGPLTIEEGQSLAIAMRDRVRLETAEAVADADSWRAHLAHLEAADIERRQAAEAIATRPRVEEAAAETALTPEQAAEADMWAVHIEQAEQHQERGAELPITYSDEATATHEAIDAAEPWLAHIERAEAEQHQQHQEREARVEEPTAEATADARRAEMLEQAREAARILAEQRQAAAEREAEYAADEERYRQDAERAEREAEAEAERWLEL